jgi:hypothetical protein
MDLQLSISVKLNTAADDQSNCAVLQEEIDLPKKIAQIYQDSEEYLGQ